MLNREFECVFEQLKEILVPYSKNLELKVDNETEYFLNTKFIMKNGKPMYFGSVKINKNYVSFHLMPVYVFPELLNDIPPELKKRMQGKSCFNFKETELMLFKELTELVDKGYALYLENGYL